jgi:hypothetical protein
VSAVKTWQRFAMNFALCFVAFAALLPLARSIEGPVRWVVILAVGAAVGGLLTALNKARR